MTKQIIKGLTLHRPWGYAITHLGKNIENRDWPCPLPVGSYIAIHNGNKWDADAARFCQNIAIDSAIMENPDCEANKPGQIIAVVKFAGNIRLTEAKSKWLVGPVGWKFENITPIAPVPCKGAQKLWDLPADVLEQVRVNFGRARNVS